MNVVEIDDLLNNSDSEWDVPIPLEAPRLPLFNIEAFPEWVKDFVTAVSESIQVPVDTPVAMGLAALSTCIGNKFKVLAKDHWEEPLNTYNVLALGPGNRKSAVYKLMIDPIIRFETKEKERLTPIIEEEANERKATQKRIEYLQTQYSKSNKIEAEKLMSEIKELSKGINEEINPPTKINRQYTNDITPEQLASLMYQNGEKIAILTDEGGEVFEMMAGRYSKGINIDIYLKSYGGDSIRIDRANGKQISMDNPLLTIGLFVQPSVIESLPEYFSGRGLTQRFLFYLPYSSVGSREIITINIDEQLIDIYNENLEKILNLKSDGTKVLSFDEEARNYLNEMQFEAERMLGNQDISEDFKGWLSKLNGQIVRIAGILHIAENVNNINHITDKISLQTLRKADLNRSYYIQHAERAYGIINQDQNLDDIKYVLGKIKDKMRDNKSKINNQELWQTVKGRIKKSARLRDILNLLEEMNYIVNLQEGRKSVIYVNPLITK